jgi:hypothetical protein
MNNSHRNRDAAIIRQHQVGKRVRDIARDFRISPGRVQQIVKSADRHARRRSELERKYGVRPDITALPDGTPLEVLLLCDANIQGWSARIQNLEQPPYASGLPPLRTLGDLRNAADAQLLKEPNVGRKLLTELRRLCPQKTDETLERLFSKVRALPSKRKALVIDALTKICDQA